MQYYNRVKSKIEDLKSATEFLPKLPETLAVAYSVKRLIKNALEKIDSSDLSHQVESLLFNIDLEMNNPSPTFNGKDELELLAERRSRSGGEVW